jgi:hypothetical protein
MKRSILMALTAVLALAASISVAPLAQSQQPVQTTARQAATNSLAECAANKQSLDVLMLVDESTSLKGYRGRDGREVVGTDVEGRRVDALKAAATTLAGIADRTATSQKPVKVNVAMIGFGNRNDEVLGWTDLNGSNLGQVVEAGESFRSKNNQNDTDYATAFIDARAMLQRLPGYDEGKRCTSILWFTDGEYSIDIIDGQRRPYSELPVTSKDIAEKLVLEGQRSICGAGGLLDGLHLAGTKVFAIALAGQAMPQAAKTFLSNTATGTDCGTPLPAGSPEPGAYFEAGRVGDLLAPFFDIVSQVANGTPLPGISAAPVCPSTPCATGRRTFQVDQGIMSFNVLAVTTSPGISLVLTSPESTTQSLKIPAKEAAGKDKSLGSASISWTWLAPDSVVLEAKLPSESGAWNGQWSVTFVDEDGTRPGATGNANIYVYGDISPVIEASEFRSGEPKDFTVALKHGEGTPVNESLFTEVGVTASVTDPATGKRWNIDLSSPDSDGVRTGTWEAPAPDFPAAVNLSVTAQIKTSSGLALTPAVRSQSVPVFPPSSYPTVTPSNVVFPKVVGTKKVSTDLTVLGGEISGGCIWFEGDPITETKPDSAGRIVVSAETMGNSPDTCLQVKPSETVKVPLTLVADKQANGAASGTMKIAMKTDKNPDVVNTTIEWRVPLEKSVDEGTKWLVFGLLMAIGILLPLIVMWVINAVTGRFDPPGKLRVGQIAATISPSGLISRRGDAAPIELQGTDFQLLSGESRSSGFTARGLEINRKLSVNPFVSPRGEVRSGGAGVGALIPVSAGSSFEVAALPFGLAGVIVVRITKDAIAKSEALAARQERAQDDSGAKKARSGNLEVDLFVFVPATNLRGYLDLVAKRSRQISDLVDAVIAQVPVAKSAPVDGKSSVSGRAGSSAGSDTPPPGVSSGSGGTAGGAPPPGVSAGGGAAAGGAPPPGVSAGGSTATTPPTGSSSGTGDGAAPPSSTNPPKSDGGDTPPPPRHS